MLIKDIAKKLDINQTRPFTKFCKDYFKNSLLVGCEIGLDCGYNAVNMFKNLDIEWLYLIDPYCDFCDNYHNLNNAKNKKLMFKNLKSYWSKCIFLEKTSDNAIKHIPDNMDFIYIDGNHSNPFISNDIKNYYPKVIKSGILGGHDFNGSFINSVGKSVIKFAEDKNINLFGNDRDWWIIKNE